VNNLQRRNALAKAVARQHKQRASIDEWMGIAVAAGLVVVVLVGVIARAW
jgi:predicted transcriptional regulator